MSQINAIAHRARQILGRPAWRTAKWLDSAALRAIEQAASEAGLKGQLLGWAYCGVSLTALADGYVSRFVQAYGPVGNLIDLGGHIGSRRPIIVEVA